MRQDRGWHRRKEGGLGPLRADQHGDEQERHEAVQAVGLQALDQGHVVSVSQGRDLR